MKIELKHVKDLKVGDRYLDRTETNIKYSNNLTIKLISNIIIGVEKNEHKLISAFLNKKIPPSETIIYKINEEFYFTGNELFEVVYD